MNQKIIKKSSGNLLSKKNTLRSRADTEISPKLSKQLTHSLSSKFQRQPAKSSTKVTSKQVELDDSIDSAQAVELTKKLKSQILDSLVNFKTVTSNYISENNELASEVGNFQGDFEQVKVDIIEIFDETSKRKDSLMDLRRKLRDPSEKPKEPNEKLYSNCSISLEDGSRSRETLKSLNSKLKWLQQEVSELKKCIDNTEDKIVEVEEENTELKGLTLKLRDTISGDQIFLEVSQEKKSCNLCSIF